MKKNFLEELKDLIKRIRNGKSIDINEKNSKVSGEQLGNVVSYESLVMPVRPYMAFATKDNIINSKVNEIKDVLRINQSVMPICRITDDEWRKFFEIAFYYFNKNKLLYLYNDLMIETICRIIVNCRNEVTLPVILENFEMPLSMEVDDGMIEAIRREVYMATRKDNTINLQEYKKVSKR